MADSAFDRLTPHQKEAVEWAAQISHKRALKEGNEFAGLHPEEFRENRRNDLASDPKTVEATVKAYDDPKMRESIESAIRDDEALVGSSKLHVASIDVPQVPNLKGKVVQV